MISSIFRTRLPNRPSGQSTHGLRILTSLGTGPGTAGPDAGSAVGNAGIGNPDAVPPQGGPPPSSSSSSVNNDKDSAGFGACESEFECGAISSEDSNRQSSSGSNLGGNDTEDTADSGSGGGAEQSTNPSDESGWSSFANEINFFGGLSGGGLRRKRL